MKSTELSADKPIHLDHSTIDYTMNQHDVGNINLPELLSVSNLIIL